MATLSPLHQSSAIKVFAQGLDRAPDVDDRVWATLELGVLVEAWQARSWQDLFAGKLPNAHGTGLQMQQTYRLVQEAYQRTEGIVAQAEATGQVLEGASAFRETAARLRAIHADFEKRWPMFDLREMQEASARAARGELIDAEEWLRELQS